MSDDQTEVTDTEIDDDAEGHAVNFRPLDKDPRS